MLGDVLFNGLIYVYDGGCQIQESYNVLFYLQANLFQNIE